MNDRRVHRRRYSIMYLKLHDLESDSLLGQLVDMSESGIMIVSAEPLERGKHFKLRMALPEAINGKEYVDFEARMKWCNQDTNPDLFASGLELIDPPTEFRRVQEKLAENYLFSGA